MASAVPASSTYSPNIVFGTSNMNFLKHRYMNMIKTPPYVSFKKIKMRTCCTEIRFFFRGQCSKNVHPNVVVHHLRPPPVIIIGLPPTASNLPQSTTNVAIQQMVG